MASVKFNPDAPHGVIYGGGRVRFVQENRYYDSAGRQVDESGDAVKKENELKPYIQQTDALENAKLFLTQILRENPLSKAAVYRAAEQNNQPWDEVKRAQIALGVSTYLQAKTEMWRLPEIVEA